MGRITAFEYAPGRPLGDGVVFAEGVRAENGNVDGMKCDAEGSVWVTGPGGIWIFDLTRIHLGVLELPDRPLNLHWGGPSWSTLFITTSSKLYARGDTTSGRLEPFMS